MRVQKSAWGQEASSTIPSHFLIAAQHHGGLVLGAYDGPTMVGVLFGITSVKNGRPYHYSHITGVERSHQSQGVGFKLKLAQREHMIKRGQNLVEWTYDPLQAGNAYFNIRKLGATCRAYYRNLYGHLDDSLNRGRLTDRFEVEWYIRSTRVKQKILCNLAPSSLDGLLADGAELVNQTVKTGHAMRLPGSFRLGLNHPKLLVEIPHSIVRIRNFSLRLANSWTLHARRIFENYFRKGYVVSDVVLDNKESRVFYVLDSRPG